MKAQTPMRKRLINDFLIPALNSGKYGNKLCWIDKDKGIFRIYWSHKNAAKWEVDDTQVFQDWDLLKGHFRPESKNYFMSAKQRFRAALYKLSNYVTPLKSTEKTYRDYQLKLNDNESKKHCENLSKSKTKGMKKASQIAIPTPVICRNASYVSKPVEVVQKEKPALTTYNNGVRKLSAHHSFYVNKIINKKKSRDHQKETHQQNLHEKHNKQVCEPSVLRENSSTFRTSHIASQAVPVYKYHPQLPIQISPSCFVSQIYNGHENVPQNQTPHQMTVYPTQDEIYAANGILNLSMKSPSNTPPSR